MIIIMKDIKLITNAKKKYYCLTIIPNLYFFKKLNQNIFTTKLIFNLK